MCLRVGSVHAVCMCLRVSCVHEVYMCLRVGSVHAVCMCLRVSCVHEVYMCLRVSSVHAAHNTVDSLVGGVYYVSVPPNSGHLQVCFVQINEALYRHHHNVQSCLLI